MPQLIVSTNRFYASVDFKEQSVFRGFDLMCPFRQLPQWGNFISGIGVHYRFISQWPIWLTAAIQSYFSNRASCKLHVCRATAPAKFLVYVGLSHYYQIKSSLCRDWVCPWRRSKTKNEGVRLIFGLRILEVTRIPNLLSVPQTLTKLHPQQ